MKNQPSIEYPPSAAKENRNIKKLKKISAQKNHSTPKAVPALQTQSPDKATMTRRREFALSTPQRQRDANDLPRSGISTSITDLLSNWIYYFN